MQKPIRLKEIYREGQRIRAIRERLDRLNNNNSNNNQYQTLGASSSSSSSAVEPNIEKTKALFEMFGVERRII